MNFRQRIVFYLLIAFKYRNLIRAENSPKFCETRYFDGIYHFGFDIQIRSQTTGSTFWVWTLDSMSHKFLEPPQKQMAGADPIIMSTFFITRIIPLPQKCQKPMDSQTIYFCEHMSNAINLLFVRYFPNQISGKEDSFVFIVKGSVVSPNLTVNQLPWNLTFNTLEEVWPKDWDRDQLGWRASGFWPKTYDVYYIINSGNTQSSALVWNSISTLDWYRPANMKSVKLNSDVRFVGMFDNGTNLLVIGDRGHVGDYETKVYLLAIDGQSRRIEKTDIDIRQHFGCGQSTSAKHYMTTDMSELMTTDDLKKVNNNPDSDGSPIFIVIVVGIVFIVIIVLLFIAFLFIKYKGFGSKTGTQSNIRSSDTITQSQSVTTIDSNTGRQFN